MKKRIISVTIILIAIISFIINMSSIQAATQYTITVNVNDSNMGYLNNLKRDDYADLIIEYDENNMPISYTLPLDSDKATHAAPYRYQWINNAFILDKTIGATPKSTDQFELYAWVNDSGLDMSSFNLSAADSSGNIVNRLAVSNITSSTNFTAYFKPIGSNVKTITYTATNGGTVDGGTLPKITNGISPSSNGSSTPQTVTNSTPQDYVVGDTAYIQGATVTSTNAGYFFFGWTNGNKVVSVEPNFVPDSSNISTDTNYVANFTSTKNYRVVLQSNNEDWGNIVKGTAGTDIRTNRFVGAFNESGLGALAKDGYEFDHWEINGNRLSYNGTAITDGNKTLASSEFNFTAGNVYTLKAVFVEKKDYKINYEADTGGTVSTTVERFNDGETVTGSTAIPDAGYTFAGWYDGETLIQGAGKNFIPSGDYIKDGATYTAKFKSTADADIRINYVVKKYVGSVSGTNQLTLSNFTASESSVIYTDNTEDCIWGDNFDELQGSNLSTEKTDDYYFAYWVEGPETSSGKVISLDSSFTPTKKQIEESISGGESPYTITYTAVYYKNAGRFIFTVNNEDYGTIKNGSNNGLHLYNKGLTKQASSDYYETHSTYKAVPNANYEIDHWEINGQTVLTESGAVFREESFPGSQKLGTNPNILYVIKAVFREKPKVTYKAATLKQLDNDIGGYFYYVDNENDSTLPGATAYAKTASNGTEYYFAYWVALREGQQITTDGSNEDKTIPITSVDETFIPTNEQFQEYQTYAAVFLRKNVESRIIYTTNSTELGSIYSTANKSSDITNTIGIDSIQYNNIYAIPETGGAFDHWEIDGEVVYTVDSSGNQVKLSEPVLDKSTIQSIIVSNADTPYKTVIKAVFKTELPNTGSNERIMYIITGVLIVLIASFFYTRKNKRKRQVKR